MTVLYLPISVHPDRQDPAPAGEDIARWLAETGAGDLLTFLLVVGALFIFGNRIFGRR